MRILLDESVPVQIREAFPQHQAVTVEFLGWKGRENGELIQAAEQSGFEILVIADKNLRYQQNLTNRKIAILELWTNHRPTLEKHFKYIDSFVAKAVPGAYIIVPDPAKTP